VDDIEYQPIDRRIPPLPETTATSEHQKAAKMSSQVPHNTLLIPGPIEFDDEVLQSMSHYA
jgi:alanine-glyoxylate transaminase / serine-glyoxylate transaminase / serine-pyruvate transaminase